MGFFLGLFSDYDWFFCFLLGGFLFFIAIFVDLGFWVLEMIVE